MHPFIHSTFIHAAWWPYEACLRTTNQSCDSRNRCPFSLTWIPPHWTSRRWKLSGKQVQYGVKKVQGRGSQEVNHLPPAPRELLPQWRWAAGNFELPPASTERLSVVQETSSCSYSGCVFLNSALVYFCVLLPIDSLPFTICSHSIYHPRLFCEGRGGGMIVSENTSLVLAVLITDCVTLEGYFSFLGLGSWSFYLYKCQDRDQDN